MTVKAELIAALASLPEWTYELDETEEARVYADTAAIHVYLPMTEVKYFLVQRDMTDPGYVRYFGLCDLGLGFPELGWVDEGLLLVSHKVPMMRLGTQTFMSDSEFVVSSRPWTLGEGYGVCGERVPSFLERDDASAV